MIFWMAGLTQPDTLCYDCNGSTNECAFPPNSVNLELTTPCPELNILFIVDESGSISGFEEDVETAVMAFLGALNGVGPNLAFMEFSDEASLITDYVPIDQDLLDNVEGYFNGDYFNGYEYFILGQRTNWHSALDEALQIDPPDLAIFFTDGNPTIYVDSLGNVNDCSNAGTTQQPEIVNPMLLANYLKDSLFTHMFALGVGNLSETNIQRISGITKYKEGVNDITTSDFYIDNNFDSLAINLRNFALQLCGSEVAMNLKLAADTVCSNQRPLFTMQIVNSGTENSIFGLVVRDTFPSSFQNITCISNCGSVCIAATCNPAENSNVLIWDVGELAPGDTATLTVQATLSQSGPENNVIWATGTNVNPDSADADLMVYPAPDIDLGEDQTICFGQSTMIQSVVSSGTQPFNYQWNTGESTESITVNPNSSESFYLAVVDAQSCVDTTTVLVAVNEIVQASISTETVDICIGGDLTLSVLKSGGIGGYTYAWSDGSTDSTLTVAPLDTTMYSVTITDSISCQASSVITVNVTEDPEITVATSGTEICEGGVVFLSSQVIKGVGQIAYQWQMLDAGNWLDLGDGDSSVYQSPALTQGVYQYRLEVNRNIGCESYSDTVTVEVTADAVVNVASTNAQICVGGLSELNANVIAGSSSLTLQWQESPDGIGSWTDIIGANSAILPVNSDSAGTQYFKIIVTDTVNGCSSPESAVQNVIVFDDIAVNLTADNLEICLSGLANLEAAVAGGTDSLKLKWSISADSLNWTELSESGSQLNFSPDSAGVFFFSVQVADSNSGCNLPNLETIKVIVASDAQVDILADATKACLGGEIMLDAQLTGGSSATGLTWQTSPDGLGNWTDIPNAAQKIYTVSVVDSGTYYYRVIVLDTLLGCSDPASSPITLDFYYDPVVDLFADDTDVCVADTVRISALPSKGYGAYSYSWNTGSTDSVLVVSVTDTTTYSVTVTDEVNCSTTKAVVINASQLPSVSVTTDDFEMCSGGAAVLSSQVAGNAEPVMYQWQSLNLGTWDNLPGANSSSYTSPSLSTGTYDYRLAINKGANCEVFSDTSTVIVKDDVAISLGADNFDACIGGDVNLNLIVTSGSSQLYIQWQRSDNGIDGWVTLDTGVATSLSIFSDTSGVHFFRAIAIDTANGCSSPTSNVQQIRIFDDPVVQILSNDLELCVGGLTRINALVNGGTSEVKYTWSSSTDSAIWNQIPLADTSFLDVSADSVGVTHYRVAIQDTSSGCDIPTAAYAKVTVVGDATVNVIAGTNEACLGGEIVLEAVISNGSSFLKRQWQRSANGIDNWVDILDETDATLAIMESDSGTYYFRIMMADTASGCSSPASASTQVVFYLDPAVSLATNDGEVCLNDMLTLSAVTLFGSGQFGYQWQFRALNDPQWADVVNETGQLYTPPTNTIDTTLYRVILTDVAVGCGSATSDSLLVQVLQPPVASTDVKNATCSILNGSIELFFADDPDRTLLEFSLNGGITYMPAIDDTQGAVLYDSLAPGVYEVWVRWDGDQCPTLVGLESIVNVECGSISGLVSEEVLGPLSGVTLNLYADADSNEQADGAILASQISALDSGTYSFKLVPVGNYVVVQVQPAFYTDLSDYDHSTGGFDPDGVDTAGIGADNDIPVTLTADESDEDNNFIEIADLGSISGFVLNDGNQGISNVIVDLYIDSNGDGNKDGAPIGQKTTGSDGSFVFVDVIPGFYALEQTQPSLHVSSSDFDETADGDGDDSGEGPDDNIPVRITAGEIDDGNIFRENRFGSIKGKVQRQDGVGLQGVLMFLYNDTDGDGSANGAFEGFVITGPTGIFTYSNYPPGDYVVVQSQPGGYVSISDYDISTGPSDTDGLDTLGGTGPDNDIPVTLLPNEIDGGNVFVEGAPGSICGSVLTDNGRPISNVKIWLFGDSNGDGEPDGEVLDSVFADSDSGNFCFEDIFAGNYVLVEEQPEFYISVSDIDESIGAFDLDGDDSSDGPDDNIPVVLLPGEEDEDNDFIEDPFPGEIKGKVVDQINTPITNVLIRLYLDANFDGNPEGTPLDSFWTNLIGEFVFTGVEPDGYLLIEEQPANFSSISDFDNTPDGDGNDNVLGANDQIPVIIYAGEIDDGNDFIEGNPGSICGNVRDDIGVPLQNIRIELYADPNGDQVPDGDTIAVVYSDSISGNYCFENVMPSEYLLVQIQPAFYQSISDFDGSINALDTDGDDSGDGPDNHIPVVLSPSESDTGNDFVEDPDPSMIQGMVENDIGNPLFGVKIKLYNDFDNDGLPNGSPIDSVTSGFDGSFLFDDMQTGIYVLVEEQPFPYGNIEDYDQTPDPDGDDRNEGPDDNIPVVLTAGEDDSGNVFIDARPGSICGKVFTDAGYPISNVKIFLFADNNGDGEKQGDPLDSVFADSDSGNFCFEDIEPRAYVLVEEQPDNYISVSDYDESIDSLDMDGDDSADGPDDDIPVVLTPGEEDEDNVFIEDPFPGEIHGSVVDEVGNPIPGVLIKLHEDFNGDELPDGALIDTIRTNAIGNYQFTGVEPNGYLVIEEQPVNYSSISDFDHSADGDGNDNAAGANDQIPVVILPAEIDSDNNFIEGRPGGICGNVRDDKGTPLANIRIELYADIDGDQIPDGDTIGVVYSDSISGNYCFDNIAPSQYLLVQSQPSDYQSVSDIDISIDSTDADGDDSADGPDDNIPVILSPNESDTGNDFVEDPDPAFISGVVTNDIGVGMYNVEIKLFNDYNLDGIADGAPVDSTTTEFNGLYLLDSLDPGNYMLVETQPMFFGNVEDYDTTPDPDGDDRSDGPDNNIPVILRAGEVDADNLFIDSRPGSICGTVLDDKGIPLSNVQLALYYDNDGNGDRDGQALDTVFADSDSGNYCFSDLEPRNYVIVEIQPDGYGDLFDYDVDTNSIFDPDGDDSADGPDNDIPVTLSPAEEDDGNNFVDIDCPSLPQLIGDSLINVCHGDIVTFLAADQSLGTEVYSWEFGDGATPASALGPGPHDVVYDTTGANQSIGAAVALTITKTGCSVTTTQAANVKVHTTPSASINAATAQLCWYKHRTFIAGGIQDPEADYSWNFGSGAIPETASGYGPHEVAFTELKFTTVSLIVKSAFASIDCSDTTAVSFNVIECLGNIAGSVRDEANNPIGNVLILLYADDDLDGLPPMDEDDYIDLKFTINGQYAFVNIKPGNYVIKEFQPSGYTSVLDTDFSEDNDSVINIVLTDDLIPVTVEPLISDLDNDFVESSIPGAINGFIFEDFNSNGEPDATEGSDSIIVHLFDDFNVDGIADSALPSSTVLTDTSGFYEFTDVSPASYVIVKVQAQGFMSVMDLDASEDVDIVLNLNLSNDIIPVTVDPAEIDSNNYFIEIKIIPNIVTNTNDSGPGSLRYAVINTSDGDTVWFDPDLAGDTIRILSAIIVVEKNLVIYADPVPKIQVKSDVSSLLKIAAGQSVEIFNMGLTSGVSSDPAAIDNEGNLLLHNVDVYKNPLLPSETKLLRNSGNLIIRGMTQIKQ